MASVDFSVTDVPRPDVLIEEFPPAAPDAVNIRRMLLFAMPLSAALWCGIVFVTLRLLRAF